ncbi:MAG: hypothetical protein IPM66_25070 [Acidobacteriota bacterium]|nr:MAG: hypothetical protein IPM66_25070 [Acidobacteriota bacterium]
MSKSKSSPLKDACAEVIGKMEGITTSDEIVKAVLAIFPSKAKNPASSVLTELRHRGDVVPLEGGLWATTDFLAEGARFRIPLAGDDLVLGAVKTQWFLPFSNLKHPIECRFIDDLGHEIPVVTKQLDLLKLDDEQLITRLEAIADSPYFQEFGAELPTPDDPPTPLEIDESMDEETILAKAIGVFREKLQSTPLPDVEFHDMTDLFLRHRAEEGDFLIATFKSSENSYTFELEPANMVNTPLIEKRDAEFRDYIRQAVKANTRAGADKLILASYHKFPWMKQYPCGNWIEIVENDDSLRFIKVLGAHWEIAPIDYRIPLDMIAMDSSTARKLEKRGAAVEDELDELQKRVERALDSLVPALMTGGIGGPENVPAGKRPKLKSADKIDNHNNDLIYAFFLHEIERGKSETASSKKADEIKLFADVLLESEMKPLEFASFDDLGTFAFDWFPANILKTLDFDIRRVLGAIRDFYRYLASTGRIKSAGFAEMFYKLRDLTAERTELVRRLPPEYFEDVDDDDDE